MTTERGKVEPFYADNHNTIHCLDFRKNKLPDECVQMVCTSPPYWGLRKYSGEQELIWGDNNCEHQWVNYKRPPGGGHPSASAQVGATKADVQRIFDGQGAWCSLCSAWRGQLGLEPTPELYLQHCIEILREIRRVLRRDGVCFVNIGDSYATHASGGKGFTHNFRAPEVAEREGIDQPKPTAKSIGLKEKDLCLIPQRLMIAAQEDGWWIRSVIIWSKSNPMPESVTDRPTESHEYILMLTKSGTAQYWTHRDGGGTRQRPKADYRWINKETKEEITIKPEGWTPKNKMGWDRVNLWRGHDYYWDADAVREEYKQSSIDRADGSKVTTSDPDRPVRFKRILGTGRNIRTVWEFPTKPYPEAHFAVFPEKLPELCIKAGTPEVGCCSKCGAPWERILEKKPSQFNIRVRDAKAGRAAPEEGYKATQEEIERYSGNHPDPGYCRTLGWQPTCKCNAPRVPSLGLDPFMGVGTTLWVAKKLNRRCEGYELSQEYCQLAVERCRQQVLL